jgi:hypothetical protein
MATICFLDRFLDERLLRFALVNSDTFEEMVFRDEPFLRGMGYSFRSIISHGSHLFSTVSANATSILCCTST